MKDKIESNLPLYSFYKNKQYHYQTCKDGLLFLSFPKTFNDKFDGKPLIDENDFIFEFCSKKFGHKNIEDFFKNGSKNFSYRKLIEHIETFKNFEKWEYDSNKCDTIFLNYGISNLLEEIDQTYNAYIGEIERLCNNYGVACFSSVPPEDNMVLWAHYASNYKGFCIKYDLLDYVISDIGTEREDLFQSFLCNHIHKVKYVNKYFFLNAKKLLKIPVSELSDSNYIKNCIIKVLTQKHKQWSYEKEYRLIIDRNNTTVQKQYEDGNGFKIKFPFFHSIYGFNVKNKTNLDRQIKSIAKNTGCKPYNLLLSKKRCKLQDDKIYYLKSIIKRRYK